MPYLTLLVNDEPVAESVFDLPERDKSVTREVSHRINKLFLSNKIEELKAANKSRISQAGSEYEIQFNVASKLITVVPMPDNG